VGFGPCKDEPPQAEACATQSQQSPTANLSKYLRKRELVVFAPVIRTAATGLRCAVRKRLSGFLADRDCVL